MNQHPWAQQAAQAYQTYLDLVQAQKDAQTTTTTEGITMTAKDDAMLDIETQFMGIMRKIELAYGRYALNDDTARASILFRMHNAADAGRRLCDEFRIVAKEDDYADTVAPRLDYAGVDQGLCGVVDGVDYLFEKE